MELTVTQAKNYYANYGQQKFIWPTDWSAGYWEVEDAWDHGKCEIFTSQ
jgi:hypothetical protein